MGNVLRCDKPGIDIVFECGISTDSCKGSARIMEDSSTDIDAVAKHILIIEDLPQLNRF